MSAPDQGEGRKRQEFPAIKSQTPLLPNRPQDARILRIPFPMKQQGTASAMLIRKQCLNRHRMLLLRE
ncbi:MAG: hypothetical protein HQM11_11495 [SAR324 cluster bacterium]|nr:hypothetical protein [SAR324 cluster bacterium]